MLGFISPCLSQNDQRKLNTVNKRKPQVNSKLNNYTGDRTPRKAGTTNRQGPRNRQYYSPPANKSVKTSQKLQAYSGDQRVQKSKVQAPRNRGGMVSTDKSKQVASAKKMNRYQGDIAVGRESVGSKIQGPRNQTTFVAQNNKEGRRTSKKISKYQGDIVPGESRMEGPRNSDAMVVAREIDRKQAKKIANYEGDVLTRHLEKRAKERRKKDKKIANHEGDLLVRSIRKRERQARIKGKKIANYRGDIVIKRRKGTQVYGGGKVKNSYTKAQRQRQRMLKKAGKKEENQDPNNIKREKNPKYDNKKESEIWY